MSTEEEGWLVVVFAPVIEGYEGAISTDKEALLEPLEVVVPWS